MKQAVFNERGIVTMSWMSSNKIASWALAKEREGSEEEMTHSGSGDKLAESRVEGG